MVLGSIAASDYYPMPMIGHLVYVYYYYCYYYYHYYYDHSTRTALFSDFYLKDHRFPVEHYYSTTTALQTYSSSVSSASSVSTASSV